MSEIENLVEKYAGKEWDENIKSVMHYCTRKPGVVTLFWNTPNHAKVEWVNINLKDTMEGMLEEDSSDFEPKELEAWAKYLEKASRKIRRHLATRNTSSE
jgi:hypothetical protein